MSRLLGMGFVAFSLLAGSPVMASSHDCTCDEQCASDCSKASRSTVSAKNVTAPREKVASTASATVRSTKKKIVTDNCGSRRF